MIATPMPNALIWATTVTIALVTMDSGISLPIRVNLVDYADLVCGTESNTIYKF